MTIRSVIFFGIILFAGSVFADQLSLTDAMNLAVANQPLLAGQSAQIDADQQTAIAASQLPDPKLILSVGNVPIDTYSLNQDPMTQQTISVEQTIPGGNKRELRKQLATTETALSSSNLAISMLAVKRSVGLAWLDLYYPLQAINLLQSKARAYQSQIEAAKIAYANNQNPQATIWALQDGLNQLADRQLELSGQADLARAELSRWIGSAAARQLTNQLPDFPPPPDYAQLQSNLVRHPEIRKWDMAIAKAEADVALTQESRQSDWTVGLGYSKRGPAYADMVSAQVAFDLPVFPANRQDRSIAAKQFLLAQAHDQREDQLRSLTAALGAAYAQWQSASQRIQLLQKRTLPDASQRVSSAIVAYGAGKADMGSVFEAHHAMLEAELQLLTQQVTRARALVTLAYFSDGEQR